MTKVFSPNVSLSPKRPQLNVKSICRNYHSFPNLFFFLDKWNGNQLNSQSYVMVIQLCTCQLQNVWSRSKMFWLSFYFSQRWCVISAPLEAANGIAICFWFFFFLQLNQWLEFKVELTVCWSNDSLFVWSDNKNWDDLFWIRNAIK